ncbi:MAG: glycosyltransferase family 4 protein [Armatimonadetes bacterium]|nr:glycosyltransferase family 4 protein [Armatimonadota bacterium]
MAAASESKSLVFLAGDFPPDVGGIQRYAYELVKAVVSLGQEAVVIAPRREEAKAVDASLGCPVVRVPGRGKAGLALAMARALRSQIKMCTPAAVVGTKWMPEGPAYLGSSAPKHAPLILLGYGREFMPEAARPVRAFVQRKVLGAARLCLAVSHYTARNFVRAGVPEERVRVIYGGVDPDRFAGPGVSAEAQRLRPTLGTGDAPLLLTVARLVRRKGHDLVLEAMARLRAEGVDVGYAVVGDGPERQRLEAIAQGLGLGRRVIFAGAVAEHDLPLWYSACDVFVMPSRDIPGEPPEGLGLVYLEANAAGKPVIAARTGGVEDAIADGQSGILVPPDDPEALADALKRLLCEPGLAARLGEQGRNRVLSQFTWRHVAQRFLAAADLAIAQAAEKA